MFSKQKFNCYCKSIDIFVIIFIRFYVPPYTPACPFKLSPCTSVRLSASPSFIVRQSVFPCPPPLYVGSVIPSVLESHRPSVKSYTKVRFTLFIRPSVRSSVCLTLSVRVSPCTVRPTVCLTLSVRPCASPCPSVRVTHRVRPSE